MTYDVTLTEQARHDMRTIYEYIADTLMEQTVAEKQLTHIENAVYSLEEMPERFRRYEKEPWRSRNLRVMPVNNYVVLYTVNNKSHIVTVIRIMYGKRNVEKELDDTAYQDK